MAIEVIFAKHCDLHLQADQKEPGETIPPVVLPNGKPKIMELCEICRKEISYNELIELAMVAGRDPENDPNPTWKQSNRSHRPPPILPGQKVFTEKCEYCERVFKNVTDQRAKQSLSMHITRSHAEEKAAALGESMVDDMYECEHCGHRLTTADGIKKHIASKHPEKKKTKA